MKENKSTLHRRTIVVNYLPCCTMKEKAENNMAREKKGAVKPLNRNRKRRREELDKHSICGLGLIFGNI